MQGNPADWNPHLSTQYINLGGRKELRVKKNGGQLALPAV